MEQTSTCTAFDGDRILAAGAPWEVAVAVKAAQTDRPDRPVLVFDDRTGRPVDFDLRGDAAEIAARLKPAEAEPAAPRGQGRPKLGVTAREVTLLPRHWDWLAAQPGGASVTLRKLVEAARGADAGKTGVREAQAAADGFMRAMLGDQPGYEEAARALYAGAADRFAAQVEPWPAALRDYAKRLAAPAFAGVSASGGR
jgi:hypothetical protein